MTRAGVGLLVTLTTVSCGQEDRAEHSFTVRDSVGVSIAESTGPAWEAGAGWRVAAEPIVDIGGADGDLHYLFSRVVAGRLLPGGAFAVMNYGTKTLRGYSASGAFMWEMGKEGDGPGEFREPFVMERQAPDSLLVFDTSSRQLSVIGPDGALVRSTALRVPGILPPYVFAIAPHANGSVLAFTSGSSPTSVGGPPSPGIRRPSAFALRFTSTGEFLDTVAVLPGTEAGLNERQGFIAVGMPPYGHITSYAVMDKSVVVGTGDHLQVEIWSEGGELRRIVRGPDPDLAVSDADVKAYRDWYVARLPQDQRAWGATYVDGMAFPTAKAAYSYVHADTDGNIWLGASGPDRRHPDSWMVFAQEGRYLGTVSFPASFRVLDFGSSSVLGVWTDDLDTEHVRVYAVEK